jgi:hypothetical protein
MNASLLDIDEYCSRINDISGVLLQRHSKWNVIRKMMLDAGEYYRTYLDSCE